MGLVEQERATYEAMWTVADYAKTSPGEQLLPAFLEMAGIEKPKGQTVLDAGCGAGKGALKLREAGFTVTLADLTPAGLLPDVQDLPFLEMALWDPIPTWSRSLFGRKFDWVYCCDVLEHVPPTFAMLVVSRLLEASRKGVFLSIALQGDNFGVWVGKPLHQTVQGFVQWREQLSAIGHVKECRDMLMNGLFYLERR
jgi:2-polyprenyl-3-methyl-5-hydroxy-6-metoxy-1,4-benzoquinol methylase